MSFDNQTKIKSTPTPVGRFAGHMSPAWPTELAKCKSNEDLFALVDTGFINPDALNEVRARGLYQEFLEWKRRKLADVFRCNACGHELPKTFQLRSEGFCYMCDPDIKLEEPLSDQPLTK